MMKNIYFKKESLKKTHPFHIHSQNILTLLLISYGSCTSYYELVT